MHLLVKVQAGFGSDPMEREFKIEQPDDREQVSRAIASWVKRTLGEVPFRNSGSRYTVQISAAWVPDGKPAAPAAPAPVPARGRKKSRK